MVEIEDIQTLTLVAKGYMLELGGDMLDEQKKGCMNCSDKISLQIQQLILLVEQLYAKVEANDLGNETSRLYECLLSAVANYSGASISIDPKASVPNTIIDVTIITDGKPDWKDISWFDMEDGGEEERRVYFNADWAGLNPMIQIQGVKMYQVGVDYMNDGQGTIIFNVGKGLYDQQFFRAGNYQEYTPPTPYPSAGTYLLINNSSIDTSYYVSSLQSLLSGYIMSSVFDVGESLIGNIQPGQKLAYKRYLSDGTIDLSLELTNPPSTQLNTSIMDQNKSYEFIYTDS